MAFSFSLLALCIFSCSKVLIYFCFQCCIVFLSGVITNFIYFVEPKWLQLRSPDHTLSWSHESTMWGQIASTLPPLGRRQQPGPAVPPYEGDALMWGCRACLPLVPTESRAISPQPTACGLTGLETKHHTLNWKGNWRWLMQHPTSTWPVHLLDREASRQDCSWSLPSHSWTLCASPLWQNAEVHQDQNLPPQEQLFFHLLW